MLRKNQKKSRKYTIISGQDLTAEYVEPAKKNCTSATIPDTVKIGKNTYKVTDIAADAFKGCSRLKKVTIGKYVKSYSQIILYPTMKLQPLLSMNWIMNMQKITFLWNNCMPFNQYELMLCLQQSEVPEKATGGKIKLKAE